MPMNHRLLVPRQGFSSPRSISSLALWLDAQDISTLFTDSAGTVAVASDADPVGQWKDKSGNARHVSQTTANNRPAYKTAIVNGRHVIRFDGGNDELIGATPTSDLPFPYSAFAVYQSSDTNASPFGLNRVSGSFTFEGIRKSAANTVQGIQQNGASTATAEAAASDSSWHIAELLFFGTSASLTYDVRVDGGSPTQMTTPRVRNNTAIGRRVIIGGPSPFEWFAGDVAEIVAYGKVLTTSERKAVERYLAARYGITLA